MWQVVRFLLVGCINTAVGFTVIVAAMELLELDYRVANAAGYAVGGVVSLVLNRNWTFRSSADWSDVAVRWLVVLGSAYVLNLAVVILLHGVLNVDALLSQAAGIAVYTAASFMAAKLFVFRERTAASPLN